MVDIYIAMAVSFCIGVAATCILRRFGIELKTDGAQISDVPKAISAGLEDYRSTMQSIEDVIDDVTVNDSDTVASIKETLKAIKTFK